MDTFRSVLIIILHLCPLFIGCGRSTERTIPDYTYHPTSGRVLMNGKPLRGGSIEFVPYPLDGNYMCFGQIGQDGTFTLMTNTMVAASMPGAPEGTYSVVVIPAGEDAARLSPKGSFVVKPGENNFTINIP